MTFKAAFALTARNKEKTVARAVLGALEQTFPCHILLSDQFSDDRTFEVMQETVAAFKMPTRKVPKPRADDLVLDVEYEEVPFHRVDLLRCPVNGPYAMKTANEHFMWLSQQTDAEWVFQCSADDYSLPRRVEVCMAAMEGKTADVVANTMYMGEPDLSTDQNYVSGYPKQTGYIAPADGLMNYAYGSCIHGFHRDFIKKVGSAGDHTMDVFYGFLAALGRGFYAIAEPLHVHGRVADVNNMGFEGKLRGAHEKGDTTLVAQLNELNHYQLFGLYYRCAEKGKELYPLMHQNDMNACLQMMVTQACGWYLRRTELHKAGLTPGVLP